MTNDEIIFFSVIICIILIVLHMISLGFTSSYYNSVANEICLENNFTNFVQQRAIWPYTTLYEVECYNKEIVRVGGKNHYLAQESVFIEYKKE